MYLSVKEVALKWGVSDRSVRNYCASGQIAGAFLTGKTWNIPESAVKPLRKNTAKNQSDNLLYRLSEEMNGKTSGGIYHKLQIDLTYNSNHIEGSKLTHDETRYIFETNTIGMSDKVHNVDDIIETANHFRCIDMVIENASARLSEKFIKELHMVLKNGTSDSKKSWFNVGEYKKLPNQIGGSNTTSPEDVAKELKKLICEYNEKQQIELDDILDFHYKFECIHPFQDGNGRVGRLIILKQCLKNNIVPFVIDETHKLFYYRGLKEWESEKGYLGDTCLSAQDNFKRAMEYFKISF
ncbi:MAG: Fic family protein [Bacillota bacterium]